MHNALPRVLSGLLFALAVLGALRELKRMDAVESPHVNSLQGSSWNPLSAAENSLSLGGFRVPREGSVRVSLCARETLHGSLRIEHPGGVSTEPLLHDDSRSGARRSCYTAHWRSAPARALSVSLSLRVRSPTPHLERIDASAGAVITPWSLWPVALLLLSLGIFVLSPRPPREPQELPEVLNNTYPSRVLALVALVFAQILGQVPTALLGFGSVSLLLGLLLQHGSMVLMAAGLLGALNPGHPKPLPLGPIGRDKILPAMAAAALLIAIAVGVGQLLHDAAETPLGQVLERVPLRYVIAFGALMAPLPEELFFRGALLDAFSRRGPITGAWIAALIFTSMHVFQLWGSPLGLVPIALVGVTNGYLRVYTRSLTAPWLLHTFYNSALASSVLLDV